MRTVTFLSVYAGAADIAGLDLADLSAEQLASIVRKINRRVVKGWKYDRFPELCPTERRLYRAEYASGTAYSAPTATAAVEVAFTAAQQYYQALRATTGNAPATLVSGAYVVNAAYWAECASSYSGNDWASGQNYAVGTYVRNPADGRYYACHTAHTSGGSFDASQFGILTPFMAYVSRDQTGMTPIGEVIRITQNDPEVVPTTPSVIPHAIRVQGIVPFAAVVPFAIYVEFRRRVPVFTSIAWNSGTAYVAGDLVYYATTGECYEALQGGTNQNPATQTAYWRKVDFPLVLANFVTRAAGSDILRSDGQTQKADAEQAAAYAEFNDDRTAEIDGQGISDSVQVQTY